METANCQVHLGGCVMNDAGDDYERMPIEQVDSILSQLRPEYWTPERLRSASPSDKRQAVRKAFTTTGRGKVRAGGTTTRYGRAPETEPKTATIADLPPTGFLVGGEQTIQLSAIRKGEGYNYGDIDPKIVADAKAAATLIRNLTAEIAEATVPRAKRIGLELLRIKAKLKHGHFGRWLAAEFGWRSERTAQLYMRVAKGKAPSFKADFDRNAFMTVPAVAASVMCTAERILAELAPELGFPDYNHLWFVEPCAGTGEILKRMRADRRVGFDIYPRDNGAFGIEEADYTTRTLDPSKKWVVLTNMPFNDAHPVRLFNWAGEQNAVAIAIIVPTFFQRAGVENKLNRHYRRVHREVLPDNSFLRDGKIKHIASIFDIWVRSDTPRELIVEQTDHPDWEWLPRKRAAEATKWMQNWGLGVGDVKDPSNLGKMNELESHWLLREIKPGTMDRLSAMNWKKIALHTLSSPRLNKGEVVAAYKAEYDAKPGTVPRQCEEPIRLFFRGHGKSRTGGLIRQNLETAGEARKSTYGDVPADQYVRWWMQRIEQLKRVLCPDDPLIVNIKESVIDGDRSTYVLELRLAMRPMQAGPHNLLFIIFACSTSDSA
jgi:hypothetical protein